VSRHNKANNYLHTSTSRFVVGVVYNLLFKSCRFAPHCLRKTMNELCIAAIKGTQETQEALEYFLNYCATHPEAEIIYRASEMILSVDSDAVYQVASKSRSRASGYHYLGNLDGKLFNGAIFILAKIIKSVMQSAAEAECGGLYMNAKEAVPMRITLEELNHPQPATPMRTDNSTTDGIMNKTVKKAIQVNGHEILLVTG
jgi:hypothetical protein